MGGEGSRGGATGIGVRREDEGLQEYERESGLGEEKVNDGEV